LVAPGWEMADVLAKRLSGTEATFTGADMSTKLKLLGVDVASFGDAFADETGGRTIVFQDLVSGIYKKMVLDNEGKRLVGGMLVGDADDYATLLSVVKSGGELPEQPETLILGARGAAELELGESAQVCSCNNVSKGDIASVVGSGECASFDAVIACSKAGSGCGGCVPLVTNIIKLELTKLGKSVKCDLCEH